MFPGQIRICASFLMQLAHENVYKGCCVSNPRPSSTVASR